MKRVLLAASCLALLASLAAAQGPPLSVGVEVTGSATGTTGVVTATLPAAVGKVTYICGFSYSGSNATAAQNGSVTVVGTVTGTMNFGYPTLALAATVPAPPAITVPFAPICVSASAPNTAITVNGPALGAGATAATVSAWGYQR